MIEPKSGRTAALLALSYVTVLSLGLYFGEQRVATLFAPIVVSALPIAARNQQQGTLLRLLSTVLLLIWVILGALSVGYFYIPALISMFLAFLSAKEGATISLKRARDFAGSHSSKKKPRDVSRHHGALVLQSFNYLF